MLQAFTESIDKLVDKLQTWADQSILMLPNFILAIVVMLCFVLLAKLTRRIFKKTIKKFSENVAVNRLLSSIIYIGIIVIWYIRGDRRPSII